MQTQAQFLTEMGARPDLGFRQNGSFHLNGEQIALTREEFVRLAATREATYSHRLEYELTCGKYWVVSRAIVDWRLYVFRLQIAPWDSAWLRLWSSGARKDSTALLNHVLQGFISGFERTTGWRVLGFQIETVTGVDAVLLYASPRLPLPAPLAEEIPAIGRARLREGLCLLLPLRRSLAAVPAQALAVTRLRRAGFHQALGDELLSDARSEIAQSVATARLDGQRGHLEILGAWLQHHLPPDARFQLPRARRVPLSLLAHLQLDAQFARSRRQLCPADLVCSFCDKVRQVRCGHGGLLLEETCQLKRPVSPLELPIPR